MTNERSIPRSRLSYWLQRAEVPNSCCSCKARGWCEYTTLVDRLKGTHKPNKEVAPTRLAITLESSRVEEVLFGWMEQSATSGMPFDHRAVRDRASDRASDLVNCYLGKNWSYRLATRNPQLVGAKSSKLDPKRANNYNEAVVSDFFDI